MKEKRCYLTRSTKIVSNNSKIFKDSLNIKTSTPYTSPKGKNRRRSHDLSSNGSVNSSNEVLLLNMKDLIENVPPPISSRLRSRTSFKSNCYNSHSPKEEMYPLSESSSSISDDIKSPMKRMKSSKNNYSNASSIPSSRSSSKSKSIFKLPQNKKLLRTQSMLKHIDNSNELPPNRYLLRSRSFKKSTSPPLKEANEIFFRTPDPPLKPLSELCKKPQATMEKDCYTSLSQLSDYSNNSSSCLSATLLSRFVKNKSKLQYAKSSKTWKQMRKIESSQEFNDSSSCTSIGEESLSVSNLQVDPEKKILDLCDQTHIKNWSSFFEDVSNRPTQKLGEGVYGEVFRLSRGNVLKVFPVDGKLLVNGEDQMTVEDVFPEVFVSKKLTELNGKNKLYRSSNFVQLKRASMVYGKLPQILIEQWHQFRIDKGTDNECLDFLNDKQKWMALEYEFAGEPLSKYKFNGYNEVRSIIEQISLSLAVAEAAVQFEHRDLHWLNILVKPTRQVKLRYRINGTNYFGTCHGIFVTIIDFTVSRMCVDNNTVYMDMSDCPEIFEGEGDYQFEIYRMMKNDNRNNWRVFNPRSNLYWLHYLIDKLLHETSYPRGDPSSKSIELELNQLYNRILNYRSTQELIEKDVYYEKCRMNNHYYPTYDE